MENKGGPRLRGMGLVKTLLRQSCWTVTSLRMHINLGQNYKKKSQITKTKPHSLISWKGSCNNTKYTFNFQIDLSIRTGIGKIWNRPNLSSLPHLRFGFFCTAVEAYAHCDPLGKFMSIFESTFLIKNKKGFYDLTACDNCLS